MKDFASEKLGYFFRVAGRLRLGVETKYTALELADEFIKYAEMVEANPLQGLRLRPDGKTKEEKAMRVMLVDEFCVFANIKPATFRSYRKCNDNELSFVAEKIYHAITSNILQAAAAGFVKETLTARIVGLRDNQKVEQTVTHDGEVNFKLSDLVKFK